MIQNSVDQKNQKKEVSSDLVTKPFTLYIAGSDLRDKELTSVTRMDVNIDALDGIEVDNPCEFTTAGGNGGGDYTFPQGRIHLGKEMLKHYFEVLDALQDKFLTNLDSDDIYALAEKAVSGGSWNIVKYRLQERDGTEETASAPGEELYACEILRKWGAVSNLNGTSF